MRASLFAVVLLLTSGRSTAFAWGCEGHRAIAILAERYAKPSAVAAAKALLAAHPADAVQSQFCGPFPQDSIVEAATWPDDFRQMDPSTGPWHFIDFPLAVPDATAHYQSYCPSGDCAVDQIVRPYMTAKTSSDPAARARALRYLIHFIGDIHQPLHAITNGDRGGNCVPIAWFDEAPHVQDSGGMSPNLHGIWDTQLVRRLMQSVGATTPAALAAKLAPHASPNDVHAQMPTTERVLGWAAHANALARSTAYGKLPTAVPAEPASQFMIASCADNNNVIQRMAALHETGGARYAAAVRSAVKSQLLDAGKRLAAAIDALF